MGEHPCNNDGSIIAAIHHSSPNQQLADGFVMNYTFPTNRQMVMRIIINKVTQL